MLSKTFKPLLLSLQIFHIPIQSFWLTDLVRHLIQKAFGNFANELKARSEPRNKPIHKLSALLGFINIFTAEVQDAVSIIHHWGVFKGYLLFSEFPLLLGHVKAL